MLELQICGLTRQKLEDELLREQLILRCVGLQPRLLIQGEHISAIACIFTFGLFDIKTGKGNADADTLYEFVQTSIAPNPTILL